MSHTISNSTESETPHNRRTPKSKSAQRTRDARRLGIQPSNQLRSHFLALARRVRTWETHREDLAVVRPVSIGVTSLEKGAGRSTVAFNLAHALATIDEEPSLLIEADGGRHSLSRRVARSKAGLVQWLQDDADPRDCLVELPVEGVWVMGPGSTDPRDLLELPFHGLATRIQDQLDQFSHVVWDLPVAEDLTACFSICPELDGVVLVVPADGIDPKAVQRFQRQLADCETDLVGMVINQA